MARWILQCNLQRYRLRDAMRDGFDIRSWSITRHLHDIAPGDEIAMWISGPDGGVYVLGEVTSSAERSVEAPDPYWVHSAEADDVTWHVGIRLDEPLPEPIRRPVLAADPDFVDAAIIRMPGGGNPFPVSDAQWQAIASRLAPEVRRRTGSNNPARTTDEVTLEPTGQDYLASEARGRSEIDGRLSVAGWLVQSQTTLNLSAGRGVAVREFTFEKPNRRVDYLLLVDGQLVGAIEVKRAGSSLTAHQLGINVDGLPTWMNMPVYPLPFIYESTGTETRFTNQYDPEPRGRRVSSFHRPETLAEWARQITESPEVPTFRARLKTMPRLDQQGLRAYQGEAIRNTEESLAENRPRALIQMPVGSGKTFTAAHLSCRLIRHAGARRILFLVDRSSLGEEAKLAFDNVTMPPAQRKFSTEYNVQLLTSNTLDTGSRVCISTIQRVVSILNSVAKPDEDSAVDLQGAEPVGATYSPMLPPDAFDVIIIDECHRSIYGRWRQVLEYFDAYLIGLTATPNERALEFFGQNVVMAYSLDSALTDGWNVNLKMLWSYSDVLRGEGLSYQDYLEQLTLLLFLKMADEQAKPPLNGWPIIPHGLDWESLVGRDGDSLEVQYRHILTELGKYPGTLGVVFRGAPNKLQDPAWLRRLVDLIGQHQWTTLGADVLGDAYEELLTKNAEDVKSGAGQYFTPRPLIQAMVDVMHPTAQMRVCDPAAGTGGFLVAAYEKMKAGLTGPDEKRFLQDEPLHGWEISDGAARLCAMNVALHGIRAPDSTSVITVDDSLRSAPSEHFDMVLTNPPFGRRSSVKVTNTVGETERQDLWAPTSNKPAQLPAARPFVAQDQRAGRDRGAGQRSLRGSGGRDDPQEAAGGMRRAYPAAAAAWDLLRGRGQGQRAVLRPQAPVGQGVD